MALLRDHRFVELLLACALLSGLGKPSAAQDATPARVLSKEALRAKVNWKGSSFELGAPPADLPAPARQALARCAAWAEKGRYRLDLEESTRFLLVSPASNSSSEGELRLLALATDLADRELPAPPRGTPPTTPEPPANPGGQPLPEDPEGAPPARQAPEAAPSTAPSTAHGESRYGIEAAILDRDTITLFSVDDDDYPGLVVEMARGEPTLADFAVRARKTTGFTLAWPLMGAYLRTAGGSEEWNPTNELVHRAAELLLLRRFGPQPYWVLQGWAWHVELGLLKNVYCFPYRDEFVGIGEHTDWLAELGGRFSGREREPLTIEEFAGWDRTWSNSHARNSYGVVEFLMRHRPGALPSLLEDLRIDRDAKGRRDLGDGSWERDVNYWTPLAEQRRILERRAGASFLADVTRFFHEGDDFRDSK